MCHFVYSITEKSFLSDFLQSLLWGSSDIACSGHGQKRKEKKEVVTILVSKLQVVEVAEF